MIVEEDINNNNDNNNNENNNADNNDNINLPARRANTCCVPLCVCSCLVCFLVAGVAFLIVGAYMYSIYDQYGGIDYQRK